MSGITVQRRLDTARAFEVLARIDLGADAANLHDDTLPEPSWGSRLLRAYRAAPGRLILHGLPLRDDWTMLASRLRNEPPGGLTDPAGRALATTFAEALDDLAELPISFAEDRPELVEPLTRLRAALWERQGSPPPLRILDVPALGSHGRAIEQRGMRVVATSLGEPFEHVLCQIFHEEVHALSDPLVRAGREHEPRDTAPSSPAFALHRDLEHAAIEVGQAIIDARAPELAPAYRAWRRRFAAPRPAPSR